MPSPAASIRAARPISSGSRREFRVGNLYINRGITGALVDRQPFGGFKLSGIGTKAGGPDYLLEFLLTRCVTENTMRRGFAPRKSGGDSVGAAERSFERAGIDPRFRVVRMISVE